MSDSDSQARQDAHEKRAHANDLAKQAADAAAEAAEAEARATAEDEGVEYEQVDASAGTWEAAVSSGADSAPAETTGEESPGE